MEIVEALPAQVRDQALHEVGQSRVTLVSREAREGEVISIPHFSWTGTIVLVPSAGGE